MGEMFAAEDLLDLILMAEDGFWDTTDSTHVHEAPRRHMSRRARQAANLQVDWLEVPDAHIFKADLPGVKREDVKVSIEDNYLKINGERPLEKVEQPHTWHRVERPKGRFSRKFPLPNQGARMEVDAIKALLQDGVLTITIPMKGEQKPEVKTIEISAT
ncbi:hypothetical protein GOP47_0006233 [Adiantum capillus-veneris]|uniref:SHSP domain-containing protein n=1 Tax=Adiantum capillus-veneris TaxID=13818 RepID=A0A9D4ZLU4_ADICA|nr:hypothetical protein GOP47_0006233 [Adiantum capillus-veneris]